MFAWCARVTKSVFSHTFSALPQRRFFRKKTVTPRQKPLISSVLTDTTFLGGVPETPQNPWGGGGPYFWPPNPKKGAKIHFAGVFFRRENPYWPKILAGVYAPLFCLGSILGPFWPFLGVFGPPRGGGGSGAPKTDSNRAFRRESVGKIVGKTPDFGQKKKIFFFTFLGVLAPKITLFSKFFEKMCHAQVYKIYKLCFCTNINFVTKFCVQNMCCAQK